jgi:hypothetical protein
MQLHPVQKAALSFHAIAASALPAQPDSYRIAEVAQYQIDTL